MKFRASVLLLAALAATQRVAGLSALAASQAAKHGAQGQQKQQRSFTPTAFMRALEGKYVNNFYPSYEQNDWHFVTVTQTGDGTLKWTNKAGASWTLTATGYKKQLKVGSDCPYYHSNGYTTASVKWSRDGRVTGIYGPFNELYDADSFAESIIDAMVGTYENHEFEGSGKTDEHYVNLTKVDARTLTWTNRAGKSCRLNYTGVTNALNVNEACPYYRSFGSATIDWNEKNVSGIYGPGQELYNSDAYDNRVLALLAGTYENYWNGGKRRWQYVNVTNNGDRSLTWTNGDGETWTLYYKSKSTSLEVGSNCSFFPEYSEAPVTWQDGLPTSIIGPKGKWFVAHNYDSFVIGSMLAGTYENHLYDNDGKNDWHYVTLSQAQAGTRELTWSNRAQKTWSLTYNGRWSDLEVGKDSPYYNSGNTIAVLEWQWNHVRGVWGPNEEFYDADSFDEYILNKIAGDYENHMYDNGGKNDWHYATITSNPGSRSLTWTNLAGVSWTLHYKGDYHSLEVGKDCSYYSSANYHKAEVMWGGWRGDVVTGIRGPHQELYQTRYH